MRKLSNKVFKFIVDENDFDKSISDKDKVIDDIIDKMSLIGFDYKSANDGIMSYIDIDENVSEFYIRDNGDSVEPVLNILKLYYTKVKVEDCTNKILFQN